MQSLTHWSKMRVSTVASAHSRGRQVLVGLRFLQTIQYQTHEFVLT